MESGVFTSWIVEERFANIEYMTGLRCGVSPESDRVSQVMSP